MSAADTVRPRTDAVTRVLDVVFSMVVMVLTSPLLAVGALGTRLSSPGPILYRASRAGVGGQPFTMFKLRTMHVGAHTGGAITGAGDPRIFRWGRTMRRFKVDELPQLVNVLRGEMSLVGPRPEDSAIVRDHYTPWMHDSLAVRPGVTGPGALDYFAEEEALPADPAEAQATYLRDLLPRKIALDMVYVEHRSAAYYLQLILRTVCGVVRLQRLFARKSRWERDESRDYLSRVTGGAA